MVKDKGCEDSDAVWSVTKLQKSSNKLSKLSLRTIHFKRADHWMLAHKWKQKGDKLVKEREMLPCEPTQPFCGIFWTSGWRSPVDTGVWRIRLFQYEANVALFCSLNTCWICLYSSTMCSCLYTAPLMLWLNDLITKSVGLSVLERSLVGSLGP